MTLSVAQSGPALATHGDNAARSDSAAGQGEFGSLLEGGPRPGKAKPASGAAAHRASTGDDPAAEAARIANKEPAHADPVAHRRIATRDAMRVSQKPGPESVADAQALSTGSEVFNDDAEPGMKGRPPADDPAVDPTLSPAIPLIDLLAATRLRPAPAPASGEPASGDDSAVTGNGPAFGAGPGSGGSAGPTRGASATTSDPGSNNTAAPDTSFLPRAATDASGAHASSAARQRSAERSAQLSAAPGGWSVSRADRRLASEETDEMSGRPGRSRLEAQLSARRAMSLGAGAELAGSGVETSDAVEGESTADLSRPAHSGPGASGSKPSGAAPSGTPAARPFTLPSVSSGADDGGAGSVAEHAADAPRSSRKPGPAGPLAFQRPTPEARKGDDHERASSTSPNTASAPSAFTGPAQPGTVATIPALVERLTANPAWAGAAAGHPGAARAAPGHSIRLELHPAELGMVTVSLKMIGEQLSIQLSVDSEEARSRLSADADSIVKAMRSLGFEVDQVIVNQSPVASSPGHSEPTPQGGAPSREGQAMFSGQSGNGGERAQQETRHGNQGNAPAAAAVHHGASSGSDVYI